MTLMFYNSVTSVKTEIQNNSGANSYLCKSYREKTVGEEYGGLFAYRPPSPILNRVKHFNSLVVT